MEKQYKTSEARRRANAKYDAKTYKVISCKCKIPDFQCFQKYAASQDITSMSNLLYRATKYCIDNNINLAEPSEQK